jgi:hypothetical protein
MLLEIAASYGAIRAVSDLFGLCRRLKPARVEPRNVPAVRQTRQPPVRTTPHGWVAQEDFTPESGVTYSMPNGVQIDVTDFEMTLRGRTTSYR